MADFATNYMNALVQGGRDTQAAQHRNALLEMQQQNTAFNQGIAQQRLGMEQERHQMAKDALTRELAMIEEQRGKAAAIAEAENDKRLGLLFRQAEEAGDIQALNGIWAEMTAGEQGPQMPLTAETLPQISGFVRAGVDTLEGYLAGAPEPYKPQSAPGKVQADIDAGVLSEGTPLRSAGVTVNAYDPRPITGKPAEGHQRIWDEENKTYVDTLIPGSAADRAAKSLEDKSAEKDRQADLKLGTSLQSIALNLKAIDEAGPMTPVTGPGGELRRTWAGRVATGSSAMDVQNRTDQITDSAALAEIQYMRDNSPTGGAVGALTDGERVAIGNAVTALNTATSAEEYARAAKAYRDLSLDLAYGKGNWTLSDDGMSVSVGRDGPISGAQLQSMTPDQIRALGHDGLQRISPRNLTGLSDEQWDAIEGLFEE